MSRFLRTNLACRRDGNPGLGERQLELLQTRLRLLRLNDDGDVVAALHPSFH